MRERGAGRRVDVGARITVTPLPGGDFSVEVLQGATTTTHVVTVPDDLAGRLGAGDVDPAELVRQSFVFLLEREPATSIMSRFGLDVIGRHFPEYADVLGARLARP